MIHSTWLSICARCQILVCQGVEQVRLLDQLTKKKGRWTSHCWKPIVSLRAYNPAYNSMRSSKSSQQYIIGCWRTHSDVRRYIYLHALFKNLPMRSFQVTSQFFVPSMKVGSTKALNGWDLNSQHVTPTAASFIKVVITRGVHCTKHVRLYMSAQKGY